MREPRRRSVLCNSTRCPTYPNPERQSTRVNDNQNSEYVPGRDDRRTGLTSFPMYPQAATPDHACTHCSPGSWQWHAGRESGFPWTPTVAKRSDGERECKRSGCREESPESRVVTAWLTGFARTICRRRGVFKSSSQDSPCSPDREERSIAPGGGPERRAQCEINSASHGETA